jgi:hypothetical protein
MGDASGVPQALEALRVATAEEEARDAYWRIDNTVVVQGALFDAALPTAACVVTVLAASTSVARPFLLELLQQISDGEPPEGNQDLAVAINEEVRRGFGIYAALLQYGNDFERELCVDLAVSCARGEADLQERCRYYLRRLENDSTTSPRVRDYADGRLRQLEGNFSD